MILVHRLVEIPITFSLLFNKGYKSGHLNDGLFVTPSEPPVSVQFLLKNIPRLW